MSIDMTIIRQTDFDIHRIEVLLSTDIFSRDNIRNPLERSAFTEIIIHLADLLIKCKKYSSRVSFTDDIIITPNINDITDLIVYVRGALCHITSGNHLFNHTNQVFSYNIAIGKGTIFKAGETSVTSDYDDDICHYFGNQKIYLNRHIIRAYNEAKKGLLTFIDHNSKSE